MFYFTRLQRERLAGQEVGNAAEESYRINRQLLEKSRDDAVIMHPLPRTNELAYEVDRDKRAAYFRQAGYGVPVRMALIALLLGKVEPQLEQPVKRDVPKMAKGADHIKCTNQRCVTNVEKYTAPKFCRISGVADFLRCYYCDWLARIGQVGDE